ncbi:MAG: uracil-DNA glycosylase [Bacilli bacterium]|jgi:uracil-DNA glycosylase
MLIGNDWDEVLKEEYKEEYFKKLINYINHEYQTKEIFPPREKIFNAFKFTPFNKVKVIVLGQDPYHNYGEAHGLAFSVMPDVRTPPSLLNIFKELEEDLGIKRERKNLEDWAKQGVLLLNDVLTVEKNKPTSHRHKGWEEFTNKIIKILNNKETPLVFVLWGNNAREKRKLITNSKHLILEASHPSPLSSHHSFKGSRPFSQINSYLKRNKLKEIKW